jgi:hypothetical protein
MSIESIKSRIDFFLSMSEPYVMAIKGEWGVGKTYAWNKYLIEARKDGRVPSGKYSYVSLFGIKNLDQLKEAIFSNAMSNEHAGEQPSLQSFQNNTKNLLDSFSRQSWKFVKDLPYLNHATPAIQAWSFMSVSKYLICIDDLERKGASLEVKEVLGLISLLKEQKDCKVVLLLNDGTKEVEDYSKYKEKVLDLELYFSPLPEESANIAYDKSKDFHEKLSGYTIRLEISNIRILKKIESTVSLLWPLLDGCDEEIKTKVIHSAVLMGWSHYHPKAGTDVPTLEFIEAVENIYMSDKDSASEKEKDWREILLNYKFMRIDELSKTIAEIVRYGYFNVGHVKSVINRANEKVIYSRKAKGMTRAWTIFHSSFKDNETEVLQAFIDGVKESVEHIGVNDLDSIITVIRDLGGSKEATSIIDFFIESRKSTPEIFNLKSFDVFRAIKDEELNERFSSAYAIIKPQEDFRTVISRLSISNGWRDEDIDVLDGVTQQEYYEFFKKMDDPDLSSIVAACLKFARLTNADEKMNSISQKVKGALSDISNESKLNKMRMEKFGL